MNDEIVVEVEEKCYLFDEEENFWICVLEDYENFYGVKEVEVRGIIFDVELRNGGIFAEIVKITGGDLNANE